MNQKRFFITGTDTDIGKTVLSLLIMRYYFENGYTPLYFKPFQTGCDSSEGEQSDAAFIYRHIPQLRHQNHKEALLYCFKNPKAPLFAARDEKQTVNAQHVIDYINKKRNSGNPIIIEGAGGLFVPVTASTLLIDMIPMLKVRTILASRAGLGTINHTLLSIEALKNRGIHDPLVVLIKQNHAQVSEKMLQENIEAIYSFSGIKPAGVIDYTNDFSLMNNSMLDVIHTILSS